MKKLLVLFMVIFLSVGCSKTNDSQNGSSDTTSETVVESSESQNGQDKNLKLEDVEGYWECKSDDEGKVSVLLKFDWKNNIDLYFSDGSKIRSSFSVVDSTEDSIKINIRDGNKNIKVIIKTEDNGESITFKKNKKEYYFVRIPKNEFYVKLANDYGEE